VSFLERYFSLQGKTAVVTGASRGIGLACANALIDAGARCYGFSRSTPSLSEARFVSVICDISDDNAIGSAIDKVYDKEKRLDILINAAGITLPIDADAGEVQRLDLFDQTLALNLRAAYVACLRSATHMRAVGQGSIINITSIGAEFGFPENPGYVASKGGLRLLTRALAFDWARDGIRVNNIVPGYIRTDMTEASFRDPEKHNVRLRNMMIPRWGQPEDIVGAVLYLAGQASAYVTGIDLHVDGGWSAKGMS